VGMNTRSTSNKSEVNESNDLYKTAIEDQDKSKYNNLTIHISTPASFKSANKQIDFSLDDFEIDKNLFKTLITIIHLFLTLPGI